MATDIPQTDVDQIASEMAPKIQALLEASGLSQYELEGFELKKKADVKIMGLVPECKMECSVGGFPPKVSCKLVCK
ncbi:hypothetical protein [Aliiroseovarius crassostreae]|uniref:hypothetical protein n=1 Tax=Aliiroseovarius crassostreae TaxID=154981 RepID=UPI003C7C03BE